MRLSESEGPGGGRAAGALLQLMMLAWRGKNSRALRESGVERFALPFDQNSIVKAGRAASKKQNLFFLLRRSALA